MPGPQRSILSQVLSGLAKAAMAIAALTVVLEVSQMLLPSPCFPRWLMPPQETGFLRGIAIGLNTYAMDHDFHYPANLRSVPIDYFFPKPSRAERELLASPNLKYFPPPDGVPGAPGSPDPVLLIYETDTWFSSITAGGELKYHRKTGSLQRQPGLRSESQLQSP